MRCLVLGAAAGGGFPQWNCNCGQCALARAGDARAKPRSQVGMAVSADGESWLLVGASPDLRQQIAACSALWPRQGARHSPIAGVVLTSADVDGIAGLLVLREQQPLRLYAAAPLLRILHDNRLFDVLDPSLVQRIEIAPDEPVEAVGGLSLELLEMPGKIPLYHEDRSAAVAQAGATYAARISSGGRSVIIASACAEVTDAVLSRLAGADALFFDGTVFTDDEMAKAGVGTKTGRRMGHVPISGEDGSMARLSGLASRKIYFHINNTNPILLEGSPERALVEANGYEIAEDGLQISV
jgi:pyrroloquinoline quinone biosynthesis protein B